MAVSYSVTKKQWKELNKNSKPRQMTNKERSAYEQFCAELFKK